MLRPIFREDNVVINFSCTVAILAVAFWLMATFCSGCARDWKGSSIPKEGQAEIIKMLWHDELGHPGDEPFPFEITFIEQWELEADCGYVGWKINGSCAWGATVGIHYPTKDARTPAVMTLAWPDGMTWGKSAVGHEFGHADAIVRNVHGGDPDHVSGYFCDSEEVGPCVGVYRGVIKDLQAAVVAAGL